MRRPRPIEPPLTPGAAPRDLTRTLGANLRRLRTGRGLSLGQLARVSGVSRAMLGQIELAQSTPTVNVLSKIASALAVSFPALIAEANGDARSDLERGGPVGTVFAPTAGRLFGSRSELQGWTERRTPNDPRALVFYEVRLAPHAAIGAGIAPVAGGENVLVVEGRVALALRDQRHELSTGDVIFFEADAPYEYQNESAVPARLYVVMAHERALRWPLA